MSVHHGDEREKSKLCERTNQKPGKAAREKKAVLRLVDYIKPLSVTYHQLIAQYQGLFLPLNIPVGRFVYT